ncbi:Terminase [Ruminococcaceae bacterium BL-6]|nr:Terminase [Ruminococcaceae bacterium BL-6]
MNPILEYWDGIRAERFIVSKRVAKLYERLADEIRNPKGRYLFDEDRAARPIEFIERFCKHSKGEWAGRPVTLELFQKAFIAALFGFVDAETGLRKYREALFLVGRKNGKSTMAAGIALYCMIADGEPGAEIYSTATKRDQARLLFDEAQRMVKQSPELSKYIRKRKTDLYFDAGMAKFQPLGRNSDTLDGLNASLVIMDELHGVRDRNLYEVMKQSQSARRQPLLIMITTAGTVRESIYDNMYSYACNVLGGTFPDESFLPVLYELDSADEWSDPKAWAKANPGLGTIKKLDDLQRKVERAKSNAADLPGILCKDFNVRQNAASAWLTFDELNNEETYDLERFRNCYAIGGADLSITTDLTSATLLFVDKETEKRYVYQMCWLPRDSFNERVHKDKIPYDIWKDKGLLRLCNGNTIDYSDVTAWFNEMLNDYGITPLWVYYDSYSARYWVDEMQQYGFPMVRCIQGAKTLSLPMQQMGADLKAKKINYNNSPILKWCLSNTGILTDRNGNIVPIKAQQPKMRIDATMSCLDAYVGLMDHYEEFLRA